MEYIEVPLNDNNYIKEEFPKGDIEPFIRVNVEENSGKLDTGGLKDKVVIREEDEDIETLYGMYEEASAGVLINSEPKNDDFSCPFCSYKTDKDNLDEHITAEHDIKENKPIINRINSKDLNDGNSGIIKTDLHKNENHKVNGKQKNIKENKSIAVPYECDQCKSKGVIKGGLKMHRYIIHKENINKSISKGNLKQLKTTKHEGALFYCGLCDYETKDEVKVKIHQFKKHEGDFLYCDQCDYKTKVEGNFHVRQSRRHRIRQKGKVKILEGIDYKCDHCTFSAKSKYYLQKHIDDKHQDVEYNCGKCSYKSTMEGKIKSLKNRKHKRKDKKGAVFYCGLCDYKTKFEEKVNRHKFRKHEGTFIFCGQCDYKTKHEGTLKVHQYRKHKKVKDVEEVDESRRHRRRQKVKVKILEGIDYKCDHCSFSAKSKYYLQKHRDAKH